MSARKVTTSVSGPAGDKSVTMPLNWFDSAFDVAIGNTIPEVLDRLHADVASIETQFREDHDIGLKALESLRFRLGVEAEWAQRLEEAKENDEAANG